MVKKVVVISFGGSLLVPEKIDLKLLEKFKKVINKHKARYKFVIVTGGGSIARKYMSALKKENKSRYIQSMAGIAITRLNALFLTYFFGRDANETLPHNMIEAKNLLRKNDIVLCGALRYNTRETTDATAAKLARFFNSDFINLTNVSGLYNKNPLKYKDAKFIPKISWKSFYKLASKRKFKPGQHFVLDQKAAEIIMKYKIKTFILGKDIRQLDKLLSEKKFIGTIIYG